MFSKAATHKRSHIAAKMLLDGIRAQKMAIGEKLPPERIIAEEMGLSRNTIREAIANLQVMGILETRHSQGNFVANTVDENNYEMFLSLIFKNDESPFALLDARIAFEPGAALVARAHQRGVEVIAYSGPSSLTMAIMLSGLPCQRFAFHGYIAKNPGDRERELLRMEKESRNNKSTQIFIEAPFRNRHTLETLVKVLHPKTQLCVACGLTSPKQQIFTKRVEEWRKTTLPDINKVPAIFLVYSVRN